jgi:hypothetical protein
MKDLLSPSGLRQVKQIGIDYMKNARKNPVPTALRILQFGAQLYNHFNKKED